MKQESIKMVLVDKDKLLKDIKKYMIKKDLLFAKSLYKALGFKDYFGFYYFKRRIENEQKIGYPLLKKVCDAIGKDAQKYIKEV